MKIAIKTLGCKSNRYESDRLVEILNKNHDVFELNESLTNIDLLIVNTCTVTQIADRKSRQAIYGFKKINPECKVVVFGCGANVAQKDYENIPEVDFVAKNVGNIVEFVDSFLKCDVSSPRRRGSSLIHPGFPLSQNRMNRTRALVKIQDGCNNFCSYCIIPRARGPERSFPSKEILKEVIQKESQGYKEIILTGIIMGNWREDDKDLSDLIYLLIKSTKNVRFRLSSLEPENFSEKFLDLFKTGRLCSHIHMSLQSGCDSVLARMRRRYDTKFYANVSDKLKKNIPDIALTTDVIAGFPGETDDEFNETAEFVKKIGFLKMHVFPFSRRKDTAAYYMKDQIPEDIKKKRCEILRKLSEEMGMNFKKSLLGKEYEILVISRIDSFASGFTPNYIPVQFSCSKNPMKNNLKNQFIKVMLEKLDNRGNVIGLVR